MPSASVVSIRRTVGALLARHERVVLAVSGGLDSTVLLDAAIATRKPRHLVVATFDHGTGAAAMEATALVERVAGERGVDVVVGRAGASTRRSEAAWRTARWTFLREVARSCSASIATAHSADDQIETVLMRTLRDSGARGLAGLLAPSDVLRPLLTVRRAALFDYAVELELQWAEDPTNAARRFLRNRLRHDMLPALRGANPTIDRELLDLGERAAAWRRETETIAHVVSTVDREASAVDVALGAIDGLDSAQLAVLWPAVAARIGATLDRRGIDRVAAFSTHARVGSRIQLSGGWEVIRSRHGLRLRASKQATTAEAVLSPAARTTWGPWTFWPGELASPATGRHDVPGWNVSLPADQPLRVRGWRPGDRLMGAAGAPGRKVKRLLSDAGVTGHERAGWPVVLCGELIVWIPGVRRSDAAALRLPGGAPTLTLSCARHIS